MFTFDTNVLIYHLHDDPSVRYYFENIHESIYPSYISVITETELFRYPSLHLEEEAMIDNLLHLFSIVPTDSSIARHAGRLGRTYNLKLGDSIIAATALFTGTTLVTRNVRDFKKIPDLSIEAV